MSVRSIRRQTSNPGAFPGTVNEAPIYVDADTNTAKLIPGGAGSTTEVEIADVSTAQTLTNKTLTAPTLVTPVLGDATATSVTASSHLVVGAATTSGIRLDLETGTLAVREGDDSAAGPLSASTITGTVISATTALAGPGTVSATGGIRLANDDYVKSRNAANSADIFIAGINSSNEMTIGSGITNHILGSGVSPILKFGGSTSSFPALKRNTTAINVALADDSAAAPLSASILQVGTAFTHNGASNATSTYSLVKKVTGIADNSATDVLTVTVPNANHAAAIRLTILSSNGSTDAFESSRVATGTVILARTAGVDTVAAVSTLAGAQIATVGSGATHTLAYAVSAIAGASGATQTFTVTLTIDDSGNLGSNQAVILAELINAEATGVTIA